MKGQDCIKTRSAPASFQTVTVKWTIPSVLGQPLLGSDERAFVTRPGVNNNKRKTVFILILSFQG